ncbi:MAG: thioredoxin family protein [Planctomycetaceae bacterium]
MNLLTEFDAALPYTPFLERYGTEEHRRRWSDFHAQVVITPSQVELLQSFVREMKVIVLAGTWCGDCVNQCPIFEHFAAINGQIQVRYIDRDDAGELMQTFSTCGGSRVPCVIFLSEDGEVCGRHGDRTLSKYRSVMASMAGASCPTGLVFEDSLTASVIQDWLNEFERIQWMLRTSARLRQLHGD